MRWRLTLADGEVVGTWEGTKAVAKRAACASLGRAKRLPNGSTFEAVRDRRVIVTVPPYTVVERYANWYNVVDATGRVISTGSDEKQVQEAAKAWNKAGRSFPIHSTSANREEER